MVGTAGRKLRLLLAYATEDNRDKSSINPRCPHHWIFEKHGWSQAALAARLCNRGQRG